MNKYVSIVKGDLLNSSEQYICHQCNCVSTYSKGLAKVIFKRYPYSNTYGKKQRDIGTINILGNGNNERYVINMYAQIYPGKNKHTENRINYFDKCLTSISLLKPKSVAFPYNIGCGLAQGNWKTYFSMIIKFASDNEIKTVIYKLY